jgi:hypothetical protein
LVERSPRSTAWSRIIEKIGRPARSVASFMTSRWPAMNFLISSRLKPDGVTGVDPKAGNRCFCR